MIKLGTLSFYLQLFPPHSLLSLLSRPAGGDDVTRRSLFFFFFYVSRSEVFGHVRVYNRSVTFTDPQRNTRRSSSSASPYSFFFTPDRTPLKSKRNAVAESFPEREAVRRGRRDI